MLPSESELGLGSREGYPVRIRSIALLLVTTLVISLFSGVGSAWAWGNGGDSRTPYLKSIAVETPDFSREESFTVNLAASAEVTGTAVGLGTHDYILEHAIAQAIKAGANVSWIDVVEAQQGTADPDYDVAMRARFNSWGHYWFTTSTQGKAPRDVAIIYKEIVAALAAGDRKTASRKLGWIAHMLGDVSMPMHNSSYSNLIPVARQSEMHLAAEADLDYLQRYSIGTEPAQWPDDLATALNNYLPYASTVVTDTAPQQVRKLWFGNSYAKPSMVGKSAREVAILVSKRARDSYAQAFWANWATTWTSPYPGSYAIGTRPGTGQAYLITNAPGMMSASSDGIASLIIALSNPATHATGIDQMMAPAIKLTAPKREVIKKKSKLGKKILKARGKKRTKLKKKYLVAPKTLKYKAVTTVKNAQGKVVASAPVVVSWTNAQGKVLASATLWTNSKGQVSRTYTLKTPKKKTKYFFTVSLPTSNLALTRKAFTVDPKKFKRILK